MSPGTQQCVQEQGMSLVAAIRASAPKHLNSGRLFSTLLLLCVSLLSIQLPSVVSSPLSFDVQFTNYGFDPEMVLFHQTTSKNMSDKPYTAHRGRQVLPRNKRKFVPAECDCSRIDGLMYARPAPLQGKSDNEVASFKMTLCLKLDREGGAAGTKKLHGGRIGLFLFLVPYPWNADDERIEVGLDNSCTETLMDSIIGSSSEAVVVVCAHVQYDSTTELLLSTVRIGDGSCTCGRKVDRSGMPKAAAVGFGSTTAGDPINLRNILTWAFHSTLESENDHPLMTTQQPQEDAGSSWMGGEQRLRVDPWNRNAELSLVNLRYQQNWLHNFQLTCSLSVSVGFGNAV